jgi:hypothetical protein
VLPQLAHPYRLHVLHGSTYAATGRHGASPYLTNGHSPGFDSLDYVSIIDYEYAMLRNHVGSQSIPDSVAD